MTPACEKLTKKSASALGSSKHQYLKMSFPNIVTLKTKLLRLSFMRTYMQTVAALYAEKQAAEATAGK